MLFAVELEADATTQALLGALDERLATLPDLRTVRKSAVTHHLSIAAYGGLVVDRFVPELAKLAQTIPPVTLHLAYLGIFPGGVLFLGPVVTSELLALRRTFDQRLAHLGGASLAPYAEGAWVPHVTLAMNAKSPALESAVAEAIQHWRPLPARFDALRLAAYPPPQTLFHLKLTAGDPHLSASGGLPD